MRLTQIESQTALCMWETQWDDPESAKGLIAFRERAGSVEARDRVVQAAPACEALSNLLYERQHAEDTFIGPHDFEVVPALMEACFTSDGHWKRPSLEDLETLYKGLVSKWSH